MPILKEREEALERLCRSFRVQLIELLYEIQTGHPGGSLSCTEILTLLYQEFLRLEGDTRDRLVLSKGHGAPMLYLNLAEKGFFKKEELLTLRQLGSRLQGHPCRHLTPGVDLSAGPLGLGLGGALGMALSAKLLGTRERIFAILGDGEMQEGAVWEALMAASKYGADNLIAVVDYNGVQLDGTLCEIMPLCNLAERLTAFGWRVLDCDGHNISELFETFTRAIVPLGKPTAVLARTVKGKGVSFMQGKSLWHGRALSQSEYQAAIAELGGERRCQA